MKKRGSGFFVITGFLLGVIVVLVVSSISRDPVPFDPDSAAPGGMKAIRVLLNDNGINTTSVGLDSKTIARAAAGTTIYIPEPALATRTQLNRFRDAAERGATVIFGSLPPQQPIDADEQAESAGVISEWMDEVTDDQLVDAPINLIAPKNCDIAELQGLGRVDSLIMEPIRLPISGRPGLPTQPTVLGSCYGNPVEANFVEVSVDRGRLFVISHPYLWVNARLRSNPVKGGKVLDNGLTAFRLMTAAPSGSAISRVIFVGARGGSSELGTGTKGPLELLPAPAKGLIAGLVLAAIAFIWSSGVRLGKPVDETSTVAINGSELTSAIGRLFQDDPTYLNQGLASLLKQARSEVAREVGLPVDTEPAVFCRVVASRSGWDPAAVHELLYCLIRVANASELLVIEERIEELKSEVANVHAR